MKRIIFILFLFLLGCSKEDNSNLIATYELRISTLNLELTQLRSQVSQIQSELSNSLSENSSLNSQITSLNNQINNLSNQLSQSLDENNTLSNNNTNLNSQISNLSQQVNELNNTVVDLQNIVSDLLSSSESEIGYTNGIYPLSQNLYLTNDKIWIFNGVISVPSGITLTIEKGTIIKVRPGNDDYVGSLIIEKGGKLIAEGTESEPIIFTDVDDLINYSSNGISPNRSRFDRGKWGGILICGSAPAGKVTPSYLANYSINGRIITNYSGSVENDNSGIMNYVSIRHSGKQTKDWVGFNGLTLAGVGRGSSIKNIEIFSTNGDGLAVHGGKLDINNITIYNPKSDGIYFTEGYSGHVNNVLIRMGQGGHTALMAEGSTYSSGEYNLGSWINLIYIYMSKSDFTNEKQLMSLGPKLNMTLANVRFANVEDRSIKNIDTEMYEIGLQDTSSAVNLLPRGIRLLSMWFKDVSTGRTLRDIFSGSVVRDSDFQYMSLNPPYSIDIGDMEWRDWTHLHKLVIGGKLSY